MAIIIAIATITIAIFAASPHQVSAIGSPSCACQMDPTKQLYCPTVVCIDTTNGFPTAGTCLKGPGPTGCVAKTTGGGAIGDASQIMQLAKQIMDMLKPGGGGGGSGSGSGASPTNPDAGSAGCTKFYNVSKPSADPCAMYNAPSIITPDTGITLPDVSQKGLQDLVDQPVPPPTNGTSIDLSGASLQTTPPSQTPTPTPTTILDTTEPAHTAPLPAHEPSTPLAPDRVIDSGSPFHVPINFNSGVSGDIRTLDGGATVIINNQNAQANTEVAGFYGSDTSSNQQPQGLVAGMCQSRPWASNFLNYIIPPSFFDSICSLRGYQVGQPKPTAPAPQVTVTTPHRSIPKPVAATMTLATTTPTGPFIPPEANIWAVPTSVPLGSRTTIFWNTKGVTSCTVTSPDGSFNQSSLSGGGATVPLSGATTYTISCLTPSGGHITNFTTVNLAL